MCRGPGPPRLRGQGEAEGGHRVTSLLGTAPAPVPRLGPRLAAGARPLRSRPHAADAGLPRAHWGTPGAGTRRRGNSGRGGGDRPAGRPPGRQALWPRGRSTRGAAPGAAVLRSPAAGAAGAGRGPPSARGLRDVAPGPGLSLSRSGGGGGPRGTRPDLPRSPPRPQGSDLRPASLASEEAGRAACRGQVGGAVEEQSRGK